MSQIQENIEVHCVPLILVSDIWFFLILWANFGWSQIGSYIMKLVWYMFFPPIWFIFGGHNCGSYIRSQCIQKYNLISFFRAACRPAACCAAGENCKIDIKSSFSLQLHMTVFRGSHAGTCLDRRYLYGLDFLALPKVIKRIQDLKSLRNELSDDPT